MNIPNTIIQTGKSRKDINKYSIQWQQMNPSFEYAFYDDEDCRTFLKTYFDSDVIWAFNLLRPGAFKADLFRYCFLYIKGGVYVDLDCVPLIPLLDFLDPTADFISVSERREIPGVYQAFIACIPGCEILMDAVNRIVQNCKERFKPKHTDWEGILSITGPVLLAKAMNNKYKKGRHQISGLNVLLYTLVGDNIMDEYDRKLIYTKFEGFQGESYSNLVKRNLIYLDSIEPPSLGMYVIIFIIIIIIIVAIKQTHITH